MKTFRHKKTGDFGFYKDGVFKQGNCSVEIGCEPSSEFWEKAFITEDGQTRFSGDNVAWSIENEFKYMLTLHENHHMLLNNENSSYKIFSTEEKAKEHQEKHKLPIYTTEDGVELFGGERIFGVTDDLQLCYACMATNDNIRRCKVFAKRENAEKCIRDNEKKYSLNDIEKTLQGYLISSFERNKVKEYVIESLEKWKIKK